jgi:cobalt/nickel transport system permease protein
MHIPDGYLSPATCGTLYAVSAPFWYLAVNRVRKVLTNRTVPVLAVFSAFSFVLMLFNVPLPGGTTGHAVGGTLLAIVLGPWAAVLGISVVLGIQALFFGDGGLLTFGANCFNMAIVLPLVGYFIYRVVSSNSEATSPRRLLAAVAGSYAGIIAAAFVTAIELGVQPALFHAADGTPLYSPYGLNVALPAMLIGHLLVAGPVEALVTGGIVAYLQRSRSSLIGADIPGKKGGPLWVLWGVLGLLVLAAPLGLLASGTAWGEWGVGELQNMGLGAIPQGLQKFVSWWPAPLPDYGFPRLGAAVGYILSALLGIAAVGFLLWIVSRWLIRSRALRTEAAPRRRAFKARSEGFLSRSISGFTHTLESMILTEDLCCSPGLLQTFDPRIKILTFAGFLVVVALARNVWILVIVLALVVVLTLLSRIPLSFFLKRVLLFIPIFTALIAIPALFITPGQPLVSFGSQVAITEQGVHTAVLLILRVVDSLSFGVLLILTTSWTRLLAALRWLRVPSLLVSILGMTYRYVFILLRTVNSMFLARRSRTIGSFSPPENRRWLARSLASTLAKSQHLSEEVYLAMLSRGYRGEVRVLSDFRLKFRDLFWIIFVVISAMVLIWSNYL